MAARIFTPLLGAGFADFAEALGPSPARQSGTGRLHHPPERWFRLPTASTLPAGELAAPNPVPDALDRRSATRQGCGTLPERACGPGQDDRDTARYIPHP